MSSPGPNWLVRIPATRPATLLLPLFLAACAGPGAQKAPNAPAAATESMAQPKTETPLADGDYLILHWEGNWRIAVAGDKLSLYPPSKPTDRDSDGEVEAPAGPLPVTVAGSRPLLRLTATLPGGWPFTADLLVTSDGQAWLDTHRDISRRLWRKIEMPAGFGGQWQVVEPAVAKDMRLTIGPSDWTFTGDGHRDTVAGIWGDYGPHAAMFFAKRDKFLVSLAGSELRMVPPNARHPDDVWRLRRASASPETGAAPAAAPLPSSSPPAALLGTWRAAPFLARLALEEQPREIAFRAADATWTSDSAASQPLRYQASPGGRLLVTLGSSWRGELYPLGEHWLLVSTADEGYAEAYVLYRKETPAWLPAIPFAREMRAFCDPEENRRLMAKWPGSPPEIMFLAFPKDWAERHGAVSVPMLQVLDSMTAVDPSMRINMGRQAAASRGLALDACPTLPTRSLKTGTETQEEP
jgi:hypothetical protein